MPEQSPIHAAGDGFTSDAIAAINYATRMRRDFGINVVATNNSAENIPAVAFVVQKPAAPAHLVNNIAHTDNPKFKVVEVEGEGGAVQNNTVKPGK